MYHLVYSSVAINPFTESDLIKLLEQSRQYNKQVNITGMLLYAQDKFIQVLEGDKIVVNKLYSKIVVDPRHKKVTIVIEGESEERIFKDWSMGFKKLSHQEVQDLSGFKDIHTFFNEQKMNENSSLVLVFLKLFYKNRMVDYPEPIA